MGEIGGGGQNAQTSHYKINKLGDVMDSMVTIVNLTDAFGLTVGSHPDKLIIR